MSPLRAATIALSVAGLSAPLVADDWPHLYGPLANGTSAAADAFPDGATLGLEEAWRRPLGSGYASMVAVGDRIYTAFVEGDDDFAAALDLATGEEIWRHRLGDVYRGHDGSDDGSIATPTVDEGMVYYLTPRGVVHALVADDGSAAWTLDMVERFDAVKPFYGFAASPLVDGSILVLQPGGESEHNLVAVDKTTGELVWTTHYATGHTYASPLAVTLGGQRQIVALAGDRLVGVAPETGELLWSFDSEERHPDRLLPISGDRLFVPLETEGGAMVAVERDGDGWTARELWRENRIANSHGMPVEHDGVLYAFSGAILTALDVDTGETLWRGRVYDGSVIAVDGRLILLSRRSGKLQVLAPSRDEMVTVAEAQVFAAGRPAITPPSYAGGMILVRDLREAVALAPTATRAANASVAPESAPAPLEIAWRRTLEVDLEPSGAGRVAPDGDVLYATVGDGRSDALVAFAASTGDELWRSSLGELSDQAGRGPAGTPAVADGRVHVVTNGCVLRTFAAADGAALWQVDLADYDARERRRGCETSPAVAEGLVLLQTAAEEGPRLVALDAATGEPAWTSEAGQLAVYGSPAVAEIGGEAQVLLHTFTTDEPRGSLLHGLRLSDGEVLWSHAVPEGWSFRPATPLPGDRILVQGWSAATALRVVRSGDDWTAERLWHGPQLVSPVALGAEVCGSRNGALTCVDLDTGEETRSADTGNVRLAAWGDDLLVQSFGGGWVGLMRPRGASFVDQGRLAVFNVGAPSDTQPTVVGDRLYLRNLEELVALEPAGP